MPTYQGVDVEHPKIVEYGKNMVKAGKSTEEIAKRLGMPYEVVKRIERDVKKGRI